MRAIKLIGLPKYLPKEKKKTINISTHLTININIKTISSFFFSPVRVIEAYE